MSEDYDNLKRQKDEILARKKRKLEDDIRAAQEFASRDTELRKQRTEQTTRPAFQRETRYYTIKRKHLSAIQETALRAHLARLNIGTVDCVVVESDWPEYETVWQMIEDRVTGRTRPAIPADVAEEAAKAICERGWDGTTGYKWSNISVAEQEEYRRDALAALTAASATSEAPAQAEPKQPSDGLVGELSFAELRRVNLDRCINAFKHELADWSLSDWFTATMGELGEAANIAKKLNRIRDGIDAANAAHETKDYLQSELADEIADTFLYLDLTAASEGIDLASAVATKFNKTSEKLGAPHRLSILRADAYLGEQPCRE